jgi:hypothetical protein
MPSGSSESNSRGVLCANFTIGGNAIVIFIARVRLFFCCYGDEPRSEILLFEDYSFLRIDAV